MRQTIHIFAKDVRALWPQILAVLAATAAITWKQIAQADALSRAETFLLVLAVARWYLIVCAVHQEKPAGDRQWWITRPYSWKSLLAAKALVAVLLVHVPALLSDAAILVSQGLSLQSGWRNLLMRQVALALAYLLPGAALAAVTEGLVSFGLAGLSMFLLVVVAPLLAPRDPQLSWGPLLWIPPAAAAIVLAASAAAVLGWQYRHRRTMAARGLLAAATAICMAVLMTPPSAWGVGIHTRLLSAPHEAENIRLRFENDLWITKGRGAEKADTLRLRIQVADIPPNMLVQPDLLDLEIESRDGTRWEAGWRWIHPTWTWEGAPAARVNFDVPRSFLERVRTQDVWVKLSAALTVLGPERVQMVDPRSGDVAVEGVGLCGMSEADPYGYNVRCKSGAPPTEEISIIETGYQYSRPGEWSRWLAFGPSPVWTTRIVWQNQRNTEPITFRLRKPVAHLRRDLLIERVRLANFR
jgi:hypothetical protein